jgi:hypothetical protein
MVSSIVPGTAGAGALGVDPRYARSTPAAPGRREDAAALGDRVELTGAALNAARDSVRDGLMQVHQALAVGHDAQAMLVKLQAMARNGASQAELDALLSGYGQRVEAVIAGGARVAAGEDISIQAEPNAPPVVIAGVDLRLGAEAGAIAVDAGAQIDDPGLPQAAQRSLEALQEAMSRLLESARGLEAHQGLLGAAAGATGVRHDLDADGARLLALQVRQGLEGAGAPIANVEPQAVLSLFRA